MKVFKFKDLTDDRNHCHFLQIVLKNAIWCARPDSLNDEDEFKFELNYERSANTDNLWLQAIAQFRTTNYSTPNQSVCMALKHNTLEYIAKPIIDKVVHKCKDTIGITSFSIKKNGPYLWKHYGGNGNGVCIEINIPDELIGESFHRVHYVSEKIFHIDSFLEAALFNDRASEAYKNILLTKTKKWSDEEEIRFIGQRQDVNFIIDGNISEVTFGPNVPALTLEQLKAKIADHCSSNNIIISKLLACE